MKACSQECMWYELGVMGVCSILKLPGTLALAYCCVQVKYRKILLRVVPHGGGKTRGPRANTRGKTEIRTNTQRGLGRGRGKKSDQEILRLVNRQSDRQTWTDRGMNKWIHKWTDQFEQRALSKIQ